MKEQPWHTDRSRYMAGFACPWKRLLNYHAFGTGLSPDRTSPALSTGIAIHSSLELLLMAMQQGLALDSAAEVDEVIKDAPNQPVLPDLLPPGDAAETLKDNRDICRALPHAFARAGIPFLRDSFAVHSIEEELAVQLEADTSIQFNSRPDFVLKTLASEKLVVGDFKTASSFQESREILTYADDVQMMINSYQVKARYSLDYYPDYYVIILLKGNKWSASPFIHAFRREGAPPFQKEDWQPRYYVPTPEGKKRTLGRAYNKVRVSDHRPVEEWVWEMDSVQCAQQIVILGPFNVVPEKVDQFWRGLPHSEASWRRDVEACKNLWPKWGQQSTQTLLDEWFPRTFNCYTYASRCSYYQLCFKGPGWDDPFNNGFAEREPHHTTEPKPEVIK